MSSSFECLWSTDVHNNIPDRKTYFHVFMFPCFFKVHKNVQTLFSKIYKMRLGNQFVPKASNMEAWKHENILTNYNPIDCYFKSESTSVAYKHSKEEEIEITTCMEARVTWRHENMKIYFPTNKSIYLVIQKCTFFLPIKLNVTLTQHQLLTNSQRRKTSRIINWTALHNLHGSQS